MAELRFSFCHGSLCATTPCPPSSTAIRISFRVFFVVRAHLPYQLSQGINQMGVTDWYLMIKAASPQAVTAKAQPTYEITYPQLAKNRAMASTHAIVRSTGVR